MRRNSKRDYFPDGSLTRTALTTMRVREPSGKVTSSDILSWFFLLFERVGDAGGVMMIILLVKLFTDLVCRLPLPVLLLVLLGVLLWCFILLFLVAFSPRATMRIVQVIAVLQRPWYRSRRYRFHKHTNRRHAR